MRFVSYLRVSSARQGQSGLGLAAQRTSVAHYVASVGGEHLAECVEVESGKLRDRPILKDALSRCRKEGATLVIAKLDRLARNVAFVSSLMEAGSDFVAVDAPYANRLMLHILAAFAEHEREQIAARTKAALAAAKARGVKLGAHGAVLAEMRKREATEFASTLKPHLEPLIRSAVPLRAIATQLNGLGLRTREGAVWSATTVQRVVRRLALPCPPNGPSTAPYSPPKSVRQQSAPTHQLSNSAFP